MVKHIIAVFKTHFDIGFTALYDEILHKYSTVMLKDVLTTCEQTSVAEEGERFVWTMPSWPLIKTLELASPEDRARAERLIRDGRLVSHALPFTTHTESAEIDDLIFGVRYVSRLVEKYGISMPKSAKMTDVPGHTWFLVSLLAKSGVKFLHLGCNSASMPPDVPLLFWWEAPDGERVLTFYNKGGYGSSTLPPEDWQFPVWLAMKQTNDNIGPQSPQVIEDLKEEIGGRARLTVGTMDDFYSEISNCDLTDLPVVRADLADSWIHGVATYPAEMGILRRTRQEFLALRKLEACFSSEGIAVPDTSKIEECIRENSLLFSEHTWGLSVIGTLGHERAYEKLKFERQRAEDRYRRIERSWDEQRDRVRQAARGTRELHELLSSAISNQSDSNQLSVFSPYGSPRNVYAEISESELYALAEYPVQKIGSHSYLYLDRVSPLCMNPVLPGSAPPMPNQVFNKDMLGLTFERMRLEVNRETGLFSLWHGNRCLFRNSGRYVYDLIGIERITQFMREYIYRYYDWAVQDFTRSSYPEIVSERFAPQCVGVGYEHGAIVAKFRSDVRSPGEFGNAADITVEYAPVGNALRITLRLFGKACTPYVESGSLMFETAETPHWSINKTGTVVDPSRDIPPGADRTYFCAERYVRAHWRGGDVKIIPVDMPLLSFEEEGCYRWKSEYKSSKTINFNLFNNMWGTNFPQWNEGDFCYDYWIIPGNQDELPYVQQPIVLHGAAASAAHIAPFEVTDAELYSADACPDGIYFVLREKSGKTKIARLEGKPCRLFGVDYLGNTTFDYGENNSFEIKLKPYEVLMFKAVWLKSKN